MIKPQRIQLSRRKGFDLQAVSQKLNGLPAVNCARPGKWGNVYRVGKREPCGCRSPGECNHNLFIMETVAEAVAAHRFLIENQSARRRAEMINDLRGKNLACWCKPGQPCHCDTLLEIANR